MIKLMPIPGGSFLMGGDPNNLRGAYETPQHKVTVKPFLMGKYPVTQKEWAIGATLPKIERNLRPDPSDFKGQDYPVDSVSWNDAVEFCLRMTQLTGLAYSLPSEAQWEYACRAGTTTNFSFGDQVFIGQMNYDLSCDRSGTPTGSEYTPQPTRVGDFAANAFGLCDMHGNVWEWCLDHWHPSYNGAPTDGSAWLGRDEWSQQRILRGGSWYSSSNGCRSASRASYSRDNQNSFTGFRVCVNHIN